MFRLGSIGFARFGASLILCAAVCVLSWPVADATAREASPSAKRPASVAKGKVKAKTAKRARPAVSRNGAVARRSPVRHVRSVDAPRPSLGHAIGLHAVGDPLSLQSAVALVVDRDTGEILVDKNSQAVLPIASISKLMTAMVVLDAGLSLSEPIEINDADIDQLKGTGSRLALGTTLSREEMLQLALMSSENRAASSLARHYPGGEAAFVDAMNVKARLLGLWNTRFHDSTGLNPANVSSPRDLAKMVAASASYPLIREFSTAHERYVPVHGRMLRFGNTNSLVRSPEWTISVSKTGYISEAGRCLVMQTWLHQQPVVMVLMDSSGRYTRTADAKRVRKWLEQTAPQRLAAAPQGAGG